MIAVSRIVAAPDPSRRSWGGLRMSSAGEVSYQVRALTPIWTGDADGRGDRLITTGLLGSIRWWFEVLVRGLGGSACDPSDRDSRCPDERGRKCVACETFGCTGWARKFRFEVVDGDGRPVAVAIAKGQEFILRFTALRHVEDEEWALLGLALRLIADYGALGGKTTLKPSSEPGRDSARAHEDFGLIDIVCTTSGLKVPKWRVAEHLKAHGRKVSSGEYAWASLANFWCVKGRYLARQDREASDFNRVIGRPESKNRASDSRGDSWIAGRRSDTRRQAQPESKKVFSFKDPARTFGFVKTVDDFAALKARLATAWAVSEHDMGFERGDEIRQRLLQEAGCCD